MRPIVTITLMTIILLGALGVGQRWFNSSESKAAAQSNRADNSVPQARPVLRGPIAPAVDSDTWLNSPRLSWSDLRGKVVLVDFWTFDCINCRNTIPELQRWYDTYHDRGLVIIGVHSPEFSYEHDVANVTQAIRDLKIPYTVALDNDFKTWNAYHVYAWPTWFIIDKQGAIRFTHVGEGAYAESEQTIQSLLAE